MRGWRMVFLFALLVRLAFILVWYEAGQGGRLSSDSTLYYAEGRSVLEGKGFVELDGVPTTRRPPLYCVFVGALSKLTVFPLGVYIAQAAIGAASCVILFALGREMFGDKIGRLASYLMAVDYASIRFTVEVMAENLFIFFVLLSFYYLYRYHSLKQTRNILWAAFFAGLSLLIRESLLYFFLWLSTWFFVFKEPVRTCISKASAFIFVVFIVLSPWILRNSFLYGRFTMLTTASGHYLYLSNNDTVKGSSHGGEWIFDRDSYFPQGGPKLPDPYTREADRYFFKKGVEWIRNHPARFIKLIRPKLVGMWRPYQADSPFPAKLAATATYIPVIILGVIGLILNLRRWKDLFPVFSLIAYIFFLHILLHGVVRYRYPAMPFFMILAAHALIKMWEKLSGKRSIITARIP